MTQEEAKEIAEIAASKALSNFFLYLDIDVHNTESLKQFRTDLDYIRAQRKAAEDARIMIKTTIGPAAIIGLGIFVWTIFKSGFKDWLITWMH